MQEGGTVSEPRDKAIAAKSRVAALVIAATMVIWLGGQWAGRQFGLSPRYAFLFDFAALAGFFWALVVTYQAWRLRQSDKG